MIFTPPDDTCRRNRPTPEIVPPVPTPATKWVIRPSVCCQISGPVDSWCDSGLFGLAYWSGFHAPEISRASRSETL